MPFLKKIVVRDFRNIAFQELSFSSNVNCISGNNGEGKTNLLDAIYYLSMTKSAFPAPDRYNFRYGSGGFAIGGTYSMENGLESRFAIEVKEGESMLEVGKDLESKGIIENAYYFDIAMRFEEKYPYLKPGTYEVSSAMKPSEILDVIAHVDGEG